jgi:hypothetical protein
MFRVPMRMNMTEKSGVRKLKNIAPLSECDPDRTESLLMMIYLFLSMCYRKAVHAQLSAGIAPRFRPESCAR